MRARTLLFIVLVTAGALQGCHHKGKGPYLHPAPATTR